MKNKIVQVLLFAFLGAVTVVIAFLADGAAQWWLLAGGLIFLSTAILVSMLRREKQPLDEQYEYAVKDAFMSRPERELFARLNELVGKRFYVFPQVALVSLVNKVAGGAYRNELFRIVDFALVDRRTHRPRLAIELNDASHKRSDRMERDEKVRCILERAGLPLLTVETSDMPDDRTLEKRIAVLTK